MADSTDPPVRPALRRPALILSAVLVAASLLLPPSWIEASFSRGLFPWTQALLVPLSGALPVPIFASLLVVTVLAVAWVAWRRWRRAGAAGVGALPRMRAGCGHGFRSLLYLYAIFLLVWGFGYRRVPIEERWDLGPPADAATIRDVQSRILTILNRDAPAADPTPADARRARLAIATAAATLVEEREGFRPALPTHLKHPPTGFLMAIGISGIVSPFTLEAHVEAALPTPFELAIGGHELAHLLGYCGEADANLVGFVAGLRAEDAYARYATALGILRYMIADGQDRWILRRLPPRADQDLDALRAAYGRHRVKTLARVTNTVNNAYLKTQGVRRGVADYARGFALLVRACRQGIVTLPPTAPECEPPARRSDRGQDK